MSIALQEPVAQPPAVAVPPADPEYGPLYRVSVEQYLEMIRADILRDEDRVELLEGVIVAKMTRHPSHVLATRLILDALGHIPLNGWFVAKEDPIQTRDSVPEPDCSVIRGAIRDYALRHPGLGDMALVVEVAESSLARDRGAKMRIYARAAIPVYWLINLNDRRVEVYTDPTGPADHPTYRQGWAFGPEDELPVILDGREVARIAVRDLLP